VGRLLSCGKPTFTINMAEPIFGTHKGIEREVDTKDGQISVAFEVSGTDWKLTVVDNGVGKPDGIFAQPKTGLGTAIINALAKQLDAKVVTLSGAKGTTVSVTHATFTTKAAKVA
jgi:signal transduction histidine kinase